MSRTAVVILNYNGEKLLRQFLPSVIEYSGDAEIFVADNGSSDKSIEVLQRKFPSVKIVHLEKNYGFCGGYNRALRAITADYYVLLNSDVEVTQDWLSPMVHLLDDDPTIGAVQPKILSYSNRQHFEYAGAAGGFIDSLGYTFCRGRIFDAVERDEGQYNDIRPIFWASGACLMIRSSLYHHFGGLDEDFFAHMEEIDLCWKLQRAGSKVFYNGWSTVYHLGAGTLSYASPNKTYLNFRNNLILLTKHYSLTELVLKMPLRFLLDWTASAMFLFKAQPKLAHAVFRAHRDYLSGWIKTFTKRNKITKELPTYPKNMVIGFPVLLQYFMLGKKTFQSLLNSPK